MPTFLLSAQVSSINRVLRNLATQKEQSASNVGNSESVYDKLRMFNGGAAAAGWAAWYPSAAAPHLGLPQHHNTPLHTIPRDDAKRGQTALLSYTIQVMAGVRQHCDECRVVCTEAIHIEPFCPRVLLRDHLKYVGIAL